MTGPARTSRIHRRLIDALYTEAMLLADEARAYFDEVGRDERDLLDAMTRVVFSCESLKVTTRLMHVIAWLLTQRAVDAGELPARDALDPSRRLGTAPDSDEAAFEAMPMAARGLILSSIDLYRRVERLDSAQAEDAPVAVSPARTMLDRLAHAF
jgi:regulator of CtrA degradation